MAASIPPVRRAGTLTGVLPSNGVRLLNTVQLQDSLEGFLGVKERQEREREAVSRAILDAARDLFVAEGYHNVSIRKIAERIEYSPAAIYSYFPSKDDIFFALAEEGFRLLFAAPRGEPSTRPIRSARIRDGVLAGLRVQQDPSRVFRADVPRPIGPAHQPGLGALRVRSRDEGAAGRAHSEGDRRRTVSCRHPSRRGLPDSDGRHPRRGRERLCGRLAPGEDADALARDTLEAALTGLCARDSSLRFIRVLQ